MSGTGYVEGGWPFVWAAYGISAVILIGYAASLVSRYRDERRKDRRP